MHRYRFLAEALADFEEGAIFYLERADGDPGPAVRFEEAMLAALAEVREAPARWPSTDDPASTVRRCVFARRFDDWALVYVVEDDVVVIIAVSHGRRRPGYWRGRT